MQLVEFNTIQNKWDNCDILNISKAKTENNDIEFSKLHWFI